MPATIAIGLVVALDRQMGTPITISARAQSVVEERAAEEGFSSIDDYVEALILDDRIDDIFRQRWLRGHIEEGLNSDGAGTLARDRLKALVDKGIAQAICPK